MKGHGADSEIVNNFPTPAIPDNSIYLFIYLQQQTVIRKQSKKENFEMNLTNSDSVLIITACCLLVAVYNIVMQADSNRSATLCVNSRP